ncbi:Ig-like domain-containing domain [Cardinium endosymbiont of Culicoides punctatus]|uniref:Ig-like domain-containing domain n=1 Tax=Cardinium endosymbiont of Culicoides punctatus TaxID=2304601 RepID=UPI0010590F32|nr:Ig-like domain-containing domain [Cardinium endosymbiont of Culicoides punctatus]TDG95794.1 hypothetical protein CCPUN_00790 [Cardinium endosymbiont of Culicoides punctatus]
MSKTFHSKVFLAIIRRICIFPLLVVSCVTVKEPEGGPPDETPLKMVRTFPENGSLHFKDKKIRITFNKNIKVEGIHANLLIMPKLDTSKNSKQPYSYSVSGKTLKIKLNVPLKEDTTYSMYFNNAVKDTHEGTKPTDAVLTFSTGSFIDPITAKGEIKELLTNRPVGDVGIYLYSSERDPKEWQEKGVPDYCTTANKDGYFTIDHIRLGTYYVRATTGKNSKYEIDYEKDQYGFFKNPIDLNDSRTDILIPLVATDVRDFKLLRSAPQRGFFEIVFNKPIVKYQLIPLQTIGTKGKPQIYSIVSDKSSRTICIYNTFGLLEGEQFEVKLIAEDLYHTVIEQHLHINFKEGKQDIKPVKLSHTLLPRPVASILPNFTETITFNKPIREINQNLIYFEQTKDKKIPLGMEELEWNSDKTKLTIKKVFTQEEVAACLSEEQGKKEHSITKKTITLHIESEAFLAFDQDPNKKISITYPFRNEEETGTISGKIETTVEYFIIELLDSKDEIVDTIRDAKDYCFTMIPPGTYSVRVRVLNEGEEEWFPGNIRKHIEPNPVIFYEKEVGVVEKWDVTGIDLKF